MRSCGTWTLAALCAATLACGGEAKLVSVSGEAMPFDNTPDGRIAGATIWILEQPERRMTTGADGKFRFDGIRAGSEVTLVLEHPDYHTIQTGTHVVPDTGIERLTFQAVDHPTFSLFAAALNLAPDPTACHIATTVTRMGRSIYDSGAHGEAGATVSIFPPVPPDKGPVYFNARVIPQRDLTETSEDGGVVFANLAPGTYTLTATKPGVRFRPVKAKCRAGVLVNASPPWGLQAL
jgi:hypothetical protein